MLCFFGVNYTDSYIHNTIAMLFISFSIVFFRKLDILILNAGVFAIPYSKTENGYETLFQVNYLSQVYLTLLLEDCLTRAVPSRVVFVSSESHRWVPVFNIIFSVLFLKTFFVC